MPREVTLHLVDSRGSPLGFLPPYEVESPWWLETGPAVERAFELHGADVRILHLVHGDSGVTWHATHGGRVTYLAELLGGVDSTPLQPASDEGPEADHPLRPSWARPGGTARIIAWADDVLDQLHRPRVGPAIQVRAWNLSSIVRLDTATGPVWCKSVPEFFGHEGGAIAWLTRLAPTGLLPSLLAHDPVTRTVLLDHVPGCDMYDCSEEIARRMINRLVELQYRTAPHIDELRRIGLPDWRPDAFTAAVHALAARDETAEALTPGELDALRALLTQLPQRFRDIAACRLPDTLVHGDPHAGNWRSDGTSLVLLDWGDCGVGSPLFDTSGFISPIGDDARRERLVQAFIDAWRHRLPDSDPARAMDTVRPIAALRQALIYRTFLDGIEPAERVYHDGDVPQWLRQALAHA